MIKIKSIEEITEFIRPYAEKMEVELVDVEFKVGKDAALTIYLDTESGIDLKTLERFHNVINEALDELDPTFGEPYTLNVSSPGLDRALKTERDFEKTLGKRVEVKLYKPLRGKKLLVGKLVEFDQNTVTIDLGGSVEKLEKNKIAKINLEIIF